MNKEIQNYLEINSLMRRLDDLGGKFSLEFRIKDSIKDMLKDGFCKENIQTIFTIVMNEQFDKACEELDEEKAEKPQSNIELLQELAEINANENA